MLSKALLVVKSKVALGVLGVLVVVGGGTALALASSGGHGPVLSGPAGHSTTKTSDTKKKTDSHVSVEGVLKAYDAGAGTISVLEKGDKSATTIHVNSKTEVNGTHASSLKDLSKNIGQKVQVQATKQSNGTLLARKVTIEGVTNSPSAGQGNDQG